MRKEEMEVMIINRTINMLIDISLNANELMIVASGIFVSIGIIIRYVLSRNAGNSFIVAGIAIGVISFIMNHVLDKYIHKLRNEREVLWDIIDRAQ